MKSFTMSARLRRVGGNYRYKGDPQGPALPACIKDCYIETFAMGAPPPNSITITVTWDDEIPTENDDE